MRESGWSTEVSGPASRNNLGAAATLLGPCGAPFERDGRPGSMRAASSFNTALLYRQERALSRRVMAQRMGRECFAQAPRVSVESHARITTGTLK
jgi:hypothetical protein